MTNANILLVIGGGIAAYKAIELVRLLKKRAIGVRCVLTAGGQQFVTPLTLAALSENPVYTNLFDLKNESEMGHIRLSRDADLVLVCPASANLLAKMAAGIADDLATTLLLATDKPVVAAPAMNVRMWLHPATQRNVRCLASDGVHVIPPDKGAMACGEFGPGRLPKLQNIADRIAELLNAPVAPGSAVQLAGLPGSLLSGKRIVVTAGPTYEPIDPVRYIANRSSGKQGFAIAEAAAAAGAQVVLIAGPVALSTPPGTARIDVETASEMETAVNQALPADVVIMVAAVADWRAEHIAEHKIKKDGALLPLALAENVDILAALGKSAKRPTLLIGFAAETDNLHQHAQEKLMRKGCDWIIANDVVANPMGGDTNRVHLVTRGGVDSWDCLAKDEIARKLMEKIADELATAS